LAECRAVAEELGPRAIKKGLAFEVKAERDVPAVQSDPLIVRRMLEKIVANAIKFTRKGSVTIHVTRSGGQDFPIAVEVEDTGVGIDPEFLPKLGTDFSQASEGYAREFEGLGLGLALVRRYVALLGVRFEIRSAKDEGTTVTIAWPLKDMSKNSAEVSGQK
jgi:signal transduction histidine kinase